MKKIMKGLTSSISAAFAISTMASSDDVIVEKFEESSFQGLTFDSQANVGEFPLYLAAHRSHASHGSHGSHRSSSGGSSRPAPSPSYSPAPVYNPPEKKIESDPLGQEPKPKKTFKPAVPDDISLTNDKKARSDVIKRVQLQLMIEGDYEGAIDGVMGPKTRDAIDIYKIKRGLKRGGYLDKYTLNALGITIN